MPKCVVAETWKFECGFCGASQLIDLAKGADPSQHGCRMVAITAYNTANVLLKSSFDVCVDCQQKRTLGELLYERSAEQVEA